MKQLGILDAAFINLEQTNTPQHVGGLGIYDPSTAPGGFVALQDVIASFERRLGRMPLFRTRIVEVPGGLDRPYWVRTPILTWNSLRHRPARARRLAPVVIQVARLHSPAGYVTASGRPISLRGWTTYPTCRRAALRCTPKCTTRW